jgi:peroxiredoxin
MDKLVTNRRCEEVSKIEEGSTAPDFTLTDTQGQSVTLSGYRGHKRVVLVFNRGFM